jgi:hypothetical protein
MNEMNEIYFIIERAVCSSSIQQYKQNNTSTKSKAYDVPVQTYETKRKIQLVQCHINQSINTMNKPNIYITTKSDITIMKVGYYTYESSISFLISLLTTLITTIDFLVSFKAFQITIPACDRQFLRTVVDNG